MIFFFVWFTSLNMIISRSIHILANGILSFFFLAEWYSSVSIYLLYPFICRWTLRLLPCPGGDCSSFSFDRVCVCGGSVSPWSLCTSVHRAGCAQPGPAACLCVLGRTGQDWVWTDALKWPRAKVEGPAAVRPPPAPPLSQPPSYSVLIYPLLPQTSETCNKTVENRTDLWHWVCVS